MRVLLKIVLDCSPDAAWDALRDPRVFAAVSAPLLSFESLEAGGFPDRWDAGDHPVRVRAAGLVPMGEQVIGISFPELPGVRAMRDTGRALSGPLRVVSRWQHTLTVAPAPGGRTLYRDRLVIGAGALTPLLWLVFWAFWQWRAIGMRRLAPTWGRAGHPGR